MPQKKTAEEEACEFQRIFSGLSPNNRQYSMAILRSLQFADAQAGTPETASGGAGGVTEVGGVRFVMPEAKILVVDDIPTNIKVAKGLLAPYRAQVDACANGVEAVARVWRSAYDLIFMDYMMPEMDGMEAVAVIRALPGPRFQEIPIIALTSNTGPGVEEMFLESGFQAYLTKPIEIQKLHTLIETWIPRGKQKNPS